MTILSGGSGAPLGSAVGKITIDASGVKSGVSQALSALGQLQTVAVTVGAALGVALVAGTAAAGAALGALGIKAIQAGSDVEEMMGKYAVVFGQYAAEVGVTLADLAGEVGRNRYELMGFASTFQDTFVPLGFTRDAAADLSVALTELTVDMGSFNNVAEPQVLMDLQSAIVGNHETMRKYGVIITETTLGQELMRMGIQGGTAAATEQEKVMARLNIIYAGTADAQGDAIRTAGSFANQMRALKSSVQETVQGIGLGLLPLATQFIGAFRAIEPALSRILAGVFAILRNIVEVGIEFVRALASALGINFDSLAGDAETWGANIVTMLANGMAAAASAVISVLNELGQMIAYWLAPGSPPRLLPDLPDWGASAMTEFMNGWASGDFSVFDTIYGTVEQAIRNLSAGLPETDLINHLIGSREAIAQAMEQMRTVGVVSQETMDAIVAGAGPAAEAVREYITAMLQSEGAVSALNKAQAQLQSIQDITQDNFRTWAGDINSSLIPAVNAYRQALGQVEAMEQGLARAQAALQAIQDVSVDNWRQFSATLRGNVSPAMQAHLSALRQLEQANTAYEQAQARVNAVTQKYDALLAPLNAQLKALRDTQTAAAEDDQLTRLNEDINSGWLTGAELREAIAQRDTILLQRRIRETEAQRDAEVGAAKETMEAAEEAQESAEQRAEATRQAALDIARAEVEAMEKARDAAIESADAQREAMIAAAESQVEIAQAQVDALDEQIARNEAILQQMQEEVRLQNELAKAIEAAAEAAAGGAGAGGAGGAGPKVGGAGGPKIPALGGAAASAMGDISSMMEGKFGEIFANVGNIFQPIKDQAAELGRTWAGVVEGLQTKWNTFTGNLSGFSSGFSLGNLRAKFQPILDAIAPIKPAFENVFNTIIEKFTLFGQFVGNQIQKVRDWATENESTITNFLTLVGTIVGGIITVVSYVYTNMAGLFDIVLVALDGFITYLLNVVTYIMQIATGDWAGAWQTFKDQVTNFVATVQNVLIAIIDWIAGWFGSSWEEVKTTWEGLWTQIKEIVSLAWVAIKTALSEAWLAIKTFVDEQIAAFAAGWTAFWDGLKLTVETIWETVKTFIVTKLQEAFAAMGLDLDTMKARWETIWNDVKLIAETVWELIKTAVSQKFTELRTSLETSLNTLKTWWDTTWTEIKTRLETIWGLIKTAVSSRMGEVRTDVETKVSGLREWWTTAWTEIKTRLETIWSDIKIAIGNKLTEIRSLVEERINAIRSWIGEQASRFADMGRDLIQGIAQGILNNAGAVIAAITGVVEGAIAAAKALLGIASPSKVFLTIGVDMLQGMANGLKRIDPVVSQLKRVKDAILTTMQPIGGIVNDAISIPADTLNRTKSLIRDAADSATELLASRRKQVFDMMNWTVGNAAANSNVMSQMNAMSLASSPGLLLSRKSAEGDNAGKRETHIHLGQLVLPGVTSSDDMLRDLTDYQTGFGNQL